MREYGQAQCSIWQSDALEDCTDAGRLLALYLLTGPHSNGLGCYKLPDGYVMEDLHWPSERVSKGFSELSRNGFAYRFLGVVFIPKYLKWNRISNGNVATARMTEFRALPKGEAKNRAAAELLKYCKHLSAEYYAELKVFESPSETVIQTVTERVTETVCQTRSDPIRSEQDPIRSDPNTPNTRACETQTSPDERLDGFDPLTAEQATTLQEAYPRGIYRQSEWLIVQKLVNQHLANGIAFDRILASFQRYNAQCVSRELVGTQYVLSPVKHCDLSQPQFDEPFPLPKTKAEVRQDANADAGDAWLARQETENATG